MGRRKRICVKWILGVKSGTVNVWGKGKKGRGFRGASVYGGR